MNTLMYEHPLTEQHLRTVREVIGYTVVGPIGKKLACGDVGASPFRLSPGLRFTCPRTNRVLRCIRAGLGAMTEWKDIVKIVVDRFVLTRKPEEA